MVDIHSHVLYGLDDGPKTLEESVAMVRMAAAAGTTNLVASPHADMRYTYRHEIVDQKIAELRAATDGAVEIHRGCDFHLYYENIQRALENPAHYTINGRRYLLVEFSDLLILKSADKIFERMQAAGITPIVTHPERNQLLARSQEQIAQWVNAGCRVQITARSCLGGFGSEAKSAAHQLIGARLTHFVASDAHDTRHRPPVLQEAYTSLAAQYGKRVAEVLFRENPRAALAGESVEALGPEIEAKRSWWRFR